ncbi:MAG: site-specific integrase, partial [Blastocatellia bacterium]|nr:site-specific integrase [Blastocatellia bacterium]
MARKRSYQKGYVQEHNGVWTLRYRWWNYDTRRWEQRREIIEGNFKNKKAAQRASEPRMAEVNQHNNRGRGPKKTDTRITFRQFFDARWKAYTVKAGHEPSTADTYRGFLDNHILPWFGEKLMVEITPGHVTDFFQQLPELSVATRQTFYNILHVIFDLAVEYDVIEQSPVRAKLHRPSIAKVEKPVLTPQEIRNILAMLEGQERLLTLLVAVTGKRIGEILALRWQDFSAGDMQIHIRHTLYRGKLKSPKTESSKGAVQLAPAIVELLLAHKQRSSFQALDDFIFYRADGSPFDQNAVRYHLQKAMDAAGIERIKGKHG